jgi:hypothetical protein
MPRDEFGHLEHADLLLLLALWPLTAVKQPPLGNAALDGHVSNRLDVIGVIFLPRRNEMEARA